MSKNIFSSAYIILSSGLRMISKQPGLVFFKKKLEQQNCISHLLSYGAAHYSGILLFFLHLLFIQFYLDNDNWCLPHPIHSILPGELVQVEAILRERMWTQKELLVFGFLTQSSKLHKSKKLL